MVISSIGLWKIHASNLFKQKEPQMKMKKALVWSLINGGEHPQLTNEDKRISNVMPLLATLFPGINYYSVTGFHAVLRNCALPVLKKMFPDLKSAPAESIQPGDEVQVTKFLPSKGYEWQDSARWQRKFAKLLATAKK
jgi:hypothetical protein